MKTLNLMLTSSACRGTSNSPRIACKRPVLSSKCLQPNDFPKGASLKKRSFSPSLFTTGVTVSCDMICIAKECCYDGSTHRVMESEFN